MVKWDFKAFCLGVMLGCFGLGGGQALAHPHIWINNQIRLVGTGGKIKSIEVQWRFDQVYSDQIRSEYDQNRNNKFDADDVKNIQSNSFNHLSERNYFAHIFVGNKFMTGFTIAKFNAAITKDGVLYDFTLNLPNAIDPSQGSSQGSSQAPVTIGFYDDEYYVDIAYSDKDSFKSDFAAAANCKFDIVPDMKHPIYGGMFNPKVLRVSCGK
ncbi:MAG: DUF1007 family protein [Candidatus Symbiobacter sp.]|nr:DUF1007 family protein [Candidatus Symbiobacter sp.]